MILEFCEWLETTPVAIFVREATYGFSTMVGIHIIGLTLSVGTLLWFDLRLLGRSMPQTRVTEVYRRLAPFILTGFTVMFVSGAILFAGYATSAYANPYFYIKLTAMLVAGANALFYHFRTEREIAAWNDAAKPPRLAAMAGAISIAVWTIAILAGRMMAYTLY
jgi:hypothetical protein